MATQQQANGEATETVAPAIRVEHISKTYKLGRPTPTSPIPGRGWARRTAFKVFPGLRDQSATGVASEFAEPGPLREIHAVRDVSFEVAKGAAIGLAGPSGAGKSTLLKILNRTSPPSAGRVVIDGRVAPSLALAPSFLQGDITGRRNCYRLARLFGVPASVVDRRVDEIFEFAELTAKVDTNASKYSKSEYRRLGFSIALNLESDILIADEGALVGDSTFAEHVRWRIARATRDDGLTLLLKSNDLDVLQEFCTDVLWMEEGEIIDRIPGAAIVEAGRDLNQRAQDKKSSARAEPAPGLEPHRSELLDLLLLQGQSYAEAASIRDEAEDETRKLAHATVLMIAPPSVDLSPRQRRALIDYLLGQLDADRAKEMQRHLADTTVESSWARQVAYCLASAGFSVSIEIPEGSSTALAPPTLEPPAVALLKFVRAGRGHAAADAALESAMTLAKRKRLATIKWYHVAVTAGIDREEAEGIVTRMLEAEQAEPGAGRKRRIFNEQMAIMSAVAVTADGDPAETIQADEPVTFQVRLEIAAEDLRVGVAIQLKSRDGESVSLEHADYFSIGRPGAYRVSVEAPADTFEEGEYEGRVVVRTRHNKTKASVQGPVVALSVYDTREDQDDEVNIPYPGDLRWSVTLIEAAPPDKPRKRKPEQERDDEEWEDYE